VSSEELALHREWLSLEIAIVIYGGSDYRYRGIRRLKQSLRSLRVAKPEFVIGRILDLLLARRLEPASFLPLSLLVGWRWYCFSF
jgi:hypothetical protein